MAINCAFTFCTTNVFGCFTVQTHKAEVLKLLYIAWSSVQPSSHTRYEAMYNVWVHQLPTTVGTFHGLNSFSHMIYVAQISTYQNITKLLTHSKNNDDNNNDIMSKQKLIICWYWFYLWALIISYQFLPFFCCCLNYDV